jgi:hypothetical protein
MERLSLQFLAPSAEEKNDGANSRILRTVGTGESA